MNARQRRTARRNGTWVRCPECGKRGPHWVVSPFKFGVLLFDDGGFWVCDKFYGPDGRRIMGEP